jgi:hypothetical protein
MAQDQKQIWLQDYTEFANSESLPVSTSVFNSLKKKLFPNPWVVFSKVLSLHVIVGLFSLAICNQFGLNPFQTSQSLTNWFMQISNHHVCMVLCGFFFMSTTYVLASAFLSLEEMESIRRVEKLQTSLLVLVSLACFYFFGAQLVATFTLLWLVGAALGAWLSIESSYRFKVYFAR